MHPARLPLHLVPQGTLQKRDMDRQGLLLRSSRDHQVPGALLRPLLQARQHPLLLVQDPRHLAWGLGLLLPGFPGTGDGVRVVHVGRVERVFRDLREPLHEDAAAADGARRREGEALLGGDRAEHPELQDAGVSAR